jgi:hypothetical protein
MSRSSQTSPRKSWSASVVNPFMAFLNFKMSCSWHHPYSQKMIIPWGGSLCVSKLASRFWLNVNQTPSSEIFSVSRPKL